MLYNNNKTMNMFLDMRILLITLALMATFFVVSCSESNKDGYTVLKDVKINPFNKELADRGKKIFAEKCASCHKYDKKLVGPALGDVVKRRSPDYILSQMLYPEKMIASNDTVKALLAIHLTSMPNQHLTINDAKAVYDHLRDVANGGGK